MGFSEHALISSSVSVALSWIDFVLVFFLLENVSLAVTVAGGSVV